MTKINYKSKTQEKIAAMESEMWDQVKAYLANPQDMLEYLKFLRRFPQYSVRNRMMVNLQRPGATALGSFSFFKKNNVHVKKGEKGLKIFVPTKSSYFFRKVGDDSKTVSLKQATKEEKQAIKENKIKLYTHQYFVLGTVFDVTQTDLPKEEYPKLFPNLHENFATTQQYDHKQIILGINEILSNLGVKQELATANTWDQGTAKGYYRPATKTIVLNPDNTDSENDAVLLHELSHAILHSEKLNPVQESLKLTHHSKMTTAERELEAEMTAYLICSEVGIDTKESSLRYIAGWTDRGNAIDKKRLLTFFDEIVKVADYVVEIVKQTDSSEAA